MSETFKNIPEIFELETGSTLRLRSETLNTFRDLGPSDLVNVIKSNPKLQAKELSSFHYVMGADTSSSAFMAAYMNSLTYSMDDSAGWFAKPTWKITSGTYCCYNAFSNVDIRVEIHIPGGVKTFAISSSGQTIPATADLWQEAYVCSVLRCIWDQDISYTGLRKLEPLPTLSQEKKFLEACKSLFGKGPLLGCCDEDEYQSSAVNLVNNYLSRGILKYFVEGQRPLVAAEFFQDILASGATNGSSTSDDPELNALIAEAYLAGGEESKAVKILYRALKTAPNSQALLTVQANFCKSKGEFNWAYSLSKYAVNYSPSDYSAWHRMTQLALDMDDFTGALLIMNASPLFSASSERDNVPRSLPPARIHVPARENIPEVENLDHEPDFYLNSPSNIDPMLQRLQAANLRGTIRKAYTLITAVSSKVGWDDLLAIRSNVFVMEEEYFQLRTVAQERQKLNSSTNTNNNNNNNNNNAGNNNAGNANNFSTDASETNSVVNFAGGATSPKAAQNQGADEDSSTAGAAVNANPAVNTNVNNSTTTRRSSMKSFAKLQEESNLLPKSPKSSSNQVINNNNNNASSNNGTTPSSNNNTTAFTMGHSRHSSRLLEQVSSKRLCERWLDSLFMLLYEDLRVFTIWRAEMQHYQAQNSDYRRTAAEWEILGNLALRLHNKDHAKEAFAACLDQHFSLYSARKLLELHCETAISLFNSNGNNNGTLKSPSIKSTTTTPTANTNANANQEAAPIGEEQIAQKIAPVLQVASKIAAYEEHLYQHCIYPGQLGKHIFSLIRCFGLARVKAILVNSSSLSAAHQALVTPYFKHAEAHEIMGYNR